MILFRLTHLASRDFGVSHERFVEAGVLGGMVRLPARATVIEKALEVTTKVDSLFILTDVTLGFFQVWINLNLTEDQF